jgi:hypothetical protein
MAKLFDDEIVFWGEFGSADQQVGGSELDS